MTVRFSSRVDISAPNPIAAAEAKARAQGVTLGKLNDSNPTRHGLAPAEVPGEYTAEPRGPHAAREALARFLGGVDPDSLYLLSSTSQAYSWLIKLLCDAGDAVLAPKPGYPLIESIARLECVDTIEYQLQFDGSWYIDTAAIEELLYSPEGDRIRALVLINPNNPTGSYVKPEERATLVRLCRERGIAIIADEVFYDYALEPFDGNARLAGETGALTFALDGFSKMLAAPHAKVGWIRVSGPEDDVREAQRRLDVIADDYLPMSDIIADRLPGLLSVAPRQTAHVRDRVRANLATLHTLLARDEHGLVDVLRAEGGWNVLLRVPAVIDENELVLRLIGTRRLTGQPGYFFDMTTNGYLALSLLPEADEFRANVTAVLDTVAAMLDLG
ncbi:pyridoxal phosphate-dependent aminotransferase [Bifidobacterium parmae]|nr:pyridoxal phosphate-dependent aminotransferase [Bifidobacterium parmae]